MSRRLFEMLEAGDEKLMATIKDLKRMCDAYEWCGECPLNDTWNCSVSGLCDNADEIVDKWVAEHPVKTYMQDFFEKFPDAIKEKSGEPVPCIGPIYSELYGKPCPAGKCFECWNQEMKEE